MNTRNEQLLIIKPASHAESNPRSLAEYLKENHDDFVRKLLTHGAILFRGYNLSSAKIFSDCVKSCNLGDFFDYSGGTSPRKTLAEGVFTSTEAPPHLMIPPHNELSYSPVFPKHLYFYCHQPSSYKGATPIVNARAVYQDLNPILRKKLEKEGVRYLRSYHEKSIKMKALAKFSPVFLSWTQSFGTTNKEIVEEKLKKGSFEFKWLDHQRGLRTAIKLPAFREHPLTQEKVWFNQCNTFNDFLNPYCSAILGNKFAWFFRYFVLNKEELPCTTRMGNGDEFTQEDINDMMNAIEKNMIIEPWQQGDFMVIDNYLSMHGREPFKKPRSIMVSLTA